SITTPLLASLHSTATIVMFWECYYTPEFMAHFLLSQPALQYIQISESNIRDLLALFEQPTLNKLFFQHLIGLHILGLFLEFVSLTQDSMLYDYLQNQTSIEEI
uniref:hypothetical protein n=1 Tax=Salmonella sp. s51228 TaxID=3159652 RepID=UPI003980BC86